MKTKVTMWSDEEVQFLFDNPSMTLIDIAAALGRSVSAVKAKRSRLGIVAGSERGCKPWTDDERRILRENYEKLTTAELCEKLPGRSAAAIHSQAWWLRKNGRL